jgi:glutathione S-transferase
MAEMLGEKPILKYFDFSSMHGLAGRGGEIRFFMMVNGIPYEDEITSFEEWKAGAKLVAIEAGETPTGHLPVVKLGGRNLIECFSIMRMLSRKIGIYGSNIDRDYLIDMVADTTNDFRQAWFKSAFGATEDKERYLTAPDQRKFYYNLFNNHISHCKGSGSYIVGDSSCFADAVLFSLLWDDLAVHGEDNELMAANPLLASFYRAFLEQEPVSAWCKNIRPDMVA